MSYIVNGVPEQAASQNLADLLIELGYADAVVATAVNQQFVPVARRASYMLAKDDQIEILAPMQGG